MVLNGNKKEMFNFELLCLTSGALFRFDPFAHRPITVLDGCLIIDMCLVMGLSTYPYDMFKEMWKLTTI
jgi:hypothetical protein